MNTTRTAADVAGIARLAPSFELALHARNRSPKTIRGYLEAVGLFETFLVGARDADPGRRHHPGARRDVHRRPTGTVDPSTAADPVPPASQMSP